MIQVIVWRYITVVSNCDISTVFSYSYWLWIIFVSFLVQTLVTSFEIIMKNLLNKTFEVLMSIISFGCLLECD